MTGNYDPKQVIDLVNRYLEAYERRDMDVLGNLVARDSNFIAYGTDEGEEWYGWQEFKTAAEKLFSAVRELHWKRGAPRVTFSRDGNCAWFAEELVGYFNVGGHKHECNFHFSGVAENRGGQWVMVQFHRSVPVKGYAVPYLEKHGVRYD